MLFHKVIFVTMATSLALSIIAIVLFITSWAYCVGVFRTNGHLLDAAPYKSEILMSVDAGTFCLYYDYIKIISVENNAAQDWSFQNAFCTKRIRSAIVREPSWWLPLWKVSSRVQSRSVHVEVPILYFATFLAFLGMGLRRLLPRNTSLCKRCGYSLADLPGHVVCPECGSQNSRVVAAEKSVASTEPAVRPVGARNPIASPKSAVTQPSDTDDEGHRPSAPR